LAGHVARIGKKRNAYKISIGRLEKNKPFRKPTSRLEENIEMDHKEVRWGVLTGSSDRLL
jgi:hypothetical protein